MHSKQLGVLARDRYTSMYISTQVYVFVQEDVAYPRTVDDVAMD
jgi:hypothetical protein